MTTKASSNAASAAAGSRGDAERRVGTTVKDWQLVRLLGTGPRCAAYEAERKAGGERGVLKMADGVHGDEERATFLRGAYAVNRVDGERVIRIKADGVDAHGTPFVVRPWVDGQTLAEVMAAGPLEERRALTVAEQVLDALEHAHAQGVVHGAICPANVIVDGAGKARLCDFATPPGSPSEAGPPARIGPYTGPEAWSTGKATAGGDVYAVAALLYHALTGHLPRGTARTAEELAAAPVTRAAEARNQAHVKFSDQLCAVLDHALTDAKGYDSAYALLGDVRRAMRGRPPKLGSAWRPVPTASMSVVRASLMALPGLERLSQLHRPPAAARRPVARDAVAFMVLAAVVGGIVTFFVARERPQVRPGTPITTPAVVGPR